MLYGILLCCLRGVQYEHVSQSFPVNILNGIHHCALWIIHDHPNPDLPAGLDK